MSKTLTVFKARNEHGKYFTGQLHALRWDEFGRGYETIVELEAALWQMLESKSSMKSVTNLANKIEFVEQELVISEVPAPSNITTMVQRMAESDRVINRKLAHVKTIQYSTIHNLKTMFPIWELNGCHYLAHVTKFVAYDETEIVNKAIGAALRTFRKPIGSFRRGATCVAFKDEKHAMVFKLACEIEIDVTYIGPNV